MSIAINRVIGLTDERNLEKQFGLSELHISWREAIAGQRQSDPNGQAHLAPLVSWSHEGVSYRYVPQLTYRIEFRPIPFVLEQLGVRAEQYFVIDAVDLVRDISSRLATLGRTAERAD